MLTNKFTSNDVEIIAKHCRYQGFFKIDEYQLRHKLYNGGFSKTLSREIFDRGDAVVVMPYDPQSDSVVLVTQFRTGALNVAQNPEQKAEQSPWLIELIAGMFNADENPVEVAIREAQEEANLELLAENITPIMQYFSSPGGTNEMIHLYLALVDNKALNKLHVANQVFGLADEGEDILVAVVTRTAAMELLAQGKINNAATVIGLQWLQLNYQYLQDQCNKQG